MNMNVSIRYSTHLPVLMEALKRTTGDVLELGPGVFSTPVLHWLCKEQNRNLLTIESNWNWHAFCSKYYRTPNHTFLRFKNWDDAKDAISKPWDVALVDHSPSERRVVELALLADKAKYIVLHDAEPWRERYYHYSTIYPLFKYKYLFDEVAPNVAVLSNLVDVTNFSIYA